MKIKIISDLHQEFGISDLDFSNADLVILAGDTNLGTKGTDKKVSDSVSRFSKTL